MISNFNTKALASSISGTVPSGQTERADVEQAFRRLETGDKGADKSGKAAAEPPQAAVVTISAEGAKRAEAKQAVDVSNAPAPGASAAVVQQDGAGQGAQAASKAPEQPTSASAAATSGNAQGAKPAASPAPASTTATGASTTTSAGAASLSKTYEPADANEDGTVSPLEQQAYDAQVAEKKAADKAAEKSTTSGRSAEASAALKAYETVDQLRKDNGPAVA